MSQATELRPCRSPYCECEPGKCTHPGCYDARSTAIEAALAMSKEKSQQIAKRGRDAIVAAYAEAPAQPAPVVVPEGWRLVPVPSLVKIAALIDPEPVRMPNGDVMVFKNPLAGPALREISAEFRAMLAAAPQPPVQQAEFGDAYQGAREDLAIWKRRALEAEQEVRHQEQIIDHLALETQGETRFGEPVIPKAEPAPAQSVEVLGETCIDGGTCHHGCTTRCFRRECCAPFSDYIGPWQYDKPDPVQDEREAFEAKFPRPAHCIRCGDSYAATEFHAWGAQEYSKIRQGWLAALEWQATRPAQTEQQPVAEYQYRVKAKSGQVLFQRNHEGWHRTSLEYAESLRRNPFRDGYEYEIRELFTAPIAQTAPSQPEQSDDLMSGAQAFKDEMLKATRAMLHPHIEAVFAVFQQQRTALSAHRAQQESDK